MEDPPDGEQEPLGGSVGRLVALRSDLGRRRQRRRREVGLDHVVLVHAHY